MIYFALQYGNNEQEEKTSEPFTCTKLKNIGWQ